MRVPITLRHFFIASGVAIACASSSASAQTLAEVVRYAVNNYPSIAQAEANAAAADADLAKARAAYWPTLGVEAYGQNDYKRYKNDLTRPVLGIGPVARVPIYTFGRIESEIDRQEALKSAADNKISTVRDDVAIAVVEHYLSWARSIEMVALARENLAAHIRIQEDTARIVESDPGRLFDKIQAETRVEGARLTLAQREAEFQQAIARISRYWPTPMPAIRQGTPRGLDDFQKNMPRDIDSAMRETDRNHPYLTQLAEQVKAAEAAVEVARAQLRPSVNAQVSSLNNGTAQLLVNVPIFDRGATQGSIKAALANLGASKMALDEGRLQLRERMLTALVDHKTAEQRRKVSADQAKKGEALLEAYREQFLAGRRTLLDLLQTQNDYFSYRMNIVQGIYDIRLSRFRLMAAMGQLASAYDKK